MTDFLAAVAAKVAFMLLEALLAQLLSQLVAGFFSVRQPRTAS